MSAVKFKLVANIRQEKGKLKCNKLRNQDNLVPAVVYGGKKANLLISLEHNKVLKAAEHENFYSQILSLSINEKLEKVVLKDLQRHPYKPKILHLDFQRVTETDILNMQVPLHFINQDKCPGVKAGGLIIHHTNIIEVRCQAKFLPEYLEIDLATLELGQIIHLSNLKLPKHVEILALSQGKLDAPVISVQLPKATSEEENLSMTESTTGTTEDKDVKEKAKSSPQASSKSAGSPTKQDKK